MRKLIIVFSIVILACQAFAAEPKTEEQKAFYSLGVHMTRQLYMFNLSAEEYEFVKQGIADVAAGKKLIAEPEAYGQTLNTLVQTRMPAVVQKQKDLSKPYLESAAKEKGAEKTASGLIYQPINVGTGKQPKNTDTVKVHYTGTLIDGKIFDSSVKRGQPLEFPLNQVIPCWTEALAKMKVGGKAKLVCPSDIAYGDQGKPPIIPGGAALAFEVELLDVKAADTAAPKAATPAPKATKKK